ncbi:spore germination protein GerKB [Fictibacillus macauensis ZFHKF-1]|uniref:Spore germination protein GerKB n=1 Tax=Fictibacillus macauensis ZFHKF-1 TaxID=1196324 RepID=I8UJP7_9BACL|nr:GerAB/ArcD/ProY family transporter [Fictibacillus macauensis]EIT87100.1 spore germination protein GerKB [Fictibacillus macauensis ZFHKF-1]
MRLKKDDSITSAQFTFFLLQTQIGVGILSMPYNIHLIAKSDSWASVIVAGCVIQLYLFLFYRLTVKYPTLSLFDLVEKLFGRYIGRFVIFLYIVFFLLMAASILSMFSQVICLWILPLTPRWLLIIIMGGIGAYAVRGPIKNLARFFVFVSVLLIFFIVLVVYGFFEADYLNVLPMGKEGFMPIVKGSEKAMYSMLGFEVYLIVAPFVKAKPYEKLKAATISNVSVTALYTFLTFMCIVFFGIKEFDLVPQPILYMIKSFSFEVLERIDLVFLSFWIVSVATTYMGYLLAAARGMLALAKTPRKEHTPFVKLALIPTLFIATIPHGVYEAATMLNEISRLSLIFVFLIPTLLVIRSFMGKKKGDTSHDHT